MYQVVCKWMEKKSFYNNCAIVAITILFLCIASFLLAYPDLHHGDEYSDANVLNAGRNFIKFGFLKLHFLPLHDVQVEKPADLYTHYPPIPDLINGLLRYVFRSDSLYLFRVFSLAISYFSVLLWYFFVKKFSNSTLIGFFATLYFVTHPAFIQSIDSLHQLAYSEFLKNLMLLLFISMVAKDRRSGKLLISLWIIYFLQALVSFEYLVFFFLFFMLFRLLFAESKKVFAKRDIVLLACAPVCGFVLHFLQNVWYFKSFAAAFIDLRDAFFVRVLIKEGLSAYYSFSVWLNDIVIRNLFLIFPLNFLSIYLFIFVSCLIYRFIPESSKATVKKLCKLACIFLLCGNTWYVLFPSHSLEHAMLNFLSRHLLSFACICFAVAAYQLLLITLGTRRKLIAIYFFVLLLFIILFDNVLISELPITQRKKMLLSSLKSKIECFSEMRNIAEPRDVIGVNYFRYPFIRYYTDRRCIPILNAAELRQQLFLPKYFIYIPQEGFDPELLDMLHYLYTPYIFCADAYILKLNPERIKRLENPAY